MSRPPRLSVLCGFAFLACLVAPAIAQAGTLSAPSPLHFNTQVAGNGSDQQNLTITNDNTTNTHISSLSFGGPDAGEFQLFSDGCSGQTLGPGASCNVNVGWNPQNPGIKSAHLDVNNDGSPLSVAMNATALIGPRATLSPSPISFPDTVVGTSHSQTVTVTNTGDSDLFVGEMFIVTGTPQVWPISGDGCSAQQRIAPNASCQFTVGFQPIAAGSKEATVFLITNSSQRSPVTLIGMIGNGILPAPPVTAVTPASPAKLASNLFTILGHSLDTTSGSATVHVKVPGAGRLDEVVTAPAADLTSNGRHPRGSVVVARIQTRTPGAGRFKLSLRPSASARTILKKRGRLRVSVKIIYTPTGGTLRSKTTVLTLQLKRPRRHK
jgi:hypothetical protein